MRILAVGNCQVETIVPAISLLTRSCDVVGCHVWNIQKDFVNQSTLVEYMNGFDLCFFQEFFDVAGFSFSEIAILNNVIRFPNFYFEAFHPDCRYVYDLDKKAVVLTDLNHYNSALIAYLYVNGVPASDVAKAFCSEVFKALGFFDQWVRSNDSLDREFTACGLKSREFVARWMRSGPFMHSPNHPSLRAVSDVCRFYLERAGALKNDVQLPERYIQDPLLRYSVWPIYPEIASYYGFRGEYCFKGEADSSGRSAVYGLETFIESSFSHYKESELASLGDQLFSKWDSEGVLDLIHKIVTK
jgi:hypothetical protein